MNSVGSSDVRRRQIELKAARTQLKRTQNLFEQGLKSRTELDRAQTVVETAQLNYQEAVLSLLSLQPRISVREAIKYQTKDGRKFVRLTVENLTPTFDDSQFRLLSNFEGADPIPEELRRRDIQDIFVSLKAAGESSTGNELASRGTTIALPYEVHLPELKYGQSKTIEFQLLRDVSSVVVASSYKGQTKKSTSSCNRPRPRTSPPSPPRKSPKKPTWACQRPSTCGWNVRRWMCASSN
jgi:Mrp family chromosome partitioning ATPase